MVDLVLVTGGTGTLGRLVVARLRNAGCDVRVLSRRPPSTGDAITHVSGDLATGRGIDAAVVGVATVVHCAGSAKGDEDKARHLVRAAARSGTVSHLVNISVVGADLLPMKKRVDRALFGYYAAKAAAERVVAESGVPFTNLRATQFHELIFTLAQQGTRLPVVPTLAGFRFQPIAADEVAARLVELTLGRPARQVPDLGGPRTYTMAGLLRGYLGASHRRRPLVPVWLPGDAARAYRQGANLAPAHAVGRQTWEEFLASQVTSPHGSSASP